MGPKAPRSTVLSTDEETLIVAFRRHTLLPLDDCLYALQATIPHVTRSALHRLFQRHQISRLPTSEGTKVRQRFRSCPLRYVHIDLAEVWTQAGRLYVFVAIDRVSKFAFAELHERATPRLAADFLLRLIERVPYRIHTVLTDNGFNSRITVAAGASAKFSTCWRISGRSALMRLTMRVPSSRSSIGSRNSITRGPTGKSNG